jgi:uncharacterized membrane protein (UPF0182 family)
VVIVGTLLFLSLRGIARFYTDFLWFDSLGLSSVWRGVLGAKIALGVIFTGVFFALLWINLLIADRIAPRFRPTGPEEELLERYYDLVGRRSGQIRFVVAVLFALIAGAGVSQQWRSWVLFTNRVDFGVRDPLHGVDAGFYVFQLPFLGFVVGWLFASFVIILIITVVAHYLNGGVRVQTPGQRVTPAVKGHLSVLLGVLALIKAGDYWLQRYSLTTSTRGFVQGASYSDVNARMPALSLLMAISLLSVALFLFNIKRRGWTLPVVAVGLWAFAAVVVGSAYPWFVQKFVVEARGESAKEQPFIARNIEATRAAYDMTEVVEQDFAAGSTLSADELAAASDAGVFRNVGLLDPDLVSDAFRKVQAQTGWLTFGDSLDIDRYDVRGRPTLTLVGARELNEGGIPQKSWEGQHLIYTQGYGAVLSAAGQVTNGQPEYLVGGVGADQTVSEDLTVGLDEPRLYVSESMGGYAIVNNERAEIAFDGDDYRYRGTGGVVLDSVLRRAAFALRFGDLNPLVSQFLTDSSRVIHQRDVRGRVEAVAPFLAFDSDPYPVLADGRVVYVLDGYTTSDTYPYSQSFGGEELPFDSGLRRPFNYVRNAVKATVDSFDGSVNLYLVDRGGAVDPIARAYRQAFPDLFRPMSDMPASVADHLRHPQDLFRVQTTMYGLYHVQDPTRFYNLVGRWAVADKPDTEVKLGAVQQTTTLLTPSGVTVSGLATGQRVEPQYQMLQLPDEGDLSFVLTRPFVPISERDRERRETMTAFMAAKPDGTLKVYRVTSPEVLSPTLLTSKILSDDRISRQISLLANPNTGSDVQLGARIMVPVGQSLLWITPLYVTAASGSSSRVPELNSVIVSYGQKIVSEPTLAAALTEIFGTETTFDTLNTGVAPTTAATGGTAAGGTAPSSGTTTTVAPSASASSTSTTAVPSATSTTRPAGAPSTITNEAALQQAKQLLDESQAALLRGDLATYQAKVDEARRILAAQVARNAVPTTSAGQA